ncbi:deoxynucleoside kinase [Carnobacterium sp. TMP28]|uniref:deoxynucleoside kinase n=1 Tax=Carnobacterium sp. TMP28 TaxID=3397060 RepID=UPI0039E191B5
MVCLAGMIGIGKTSATKLLGDRLGGTVFYEQVDDNEILPLFYTASEEEQEQKRYPFLLQLEFLNSRFQIIKEAAKHENSIIDRSIFEDWYFAKINHDLGRISDTEFSIYEKLLDNMMSEVDEIPQKAPDLMVYMRASFETILDRIGKRGREFEQDENLYNYYYALWKDYDDWVFNHYDRSAILVIDMDEMDIVTNIEDATLFVEKVRNKLAEVIKK